MRREERERVWNKGIRNGRWRGREAVEKESRRRREEGAKWQTSPSANLMAHCDKEQRGNKGGRQG